MCLFVMPDTATSVLLCVSSIAKGVVTDTHKQDVATLIELLKMAAERWPRSEADQISQSDLLREHPCLRCGRKPADAPASEGVNFRLE